MHHHGTGKIVEFGAERGLQPILQTVMIIPGNAFKEWVNKATSMKVAASCG